MITPKMVTLRVWGDFRNVHKVVVTFEVCSEVADSKYKYISCIVPLMGRRETNR